MLGNKIFGYNNRQYDPATLTLIATAVAVGAGSAEIITALSNKPDQPSLPTSPDMNSADKYAQDAQNNQRQIAIRAGGNTNITGGSGIILGSDISSVSLVGSS